MTNEHPTNEEFILGFYSNIALNSKQRFEFDHMIHQTPHKCWFHTQILLKYRAQFDAEIRNWLHARRTHDKWVLQTIALIEILSSIRSKDLKLITWSNNTWQMNNPYQDSIEILCSNWSKDLKFITRSNSTWQMKNS